MINDKERLLNVHEWPSLGDGWGHYCCLKKLKGTGYDYAFVLEADNPNGMHGEVVVSLGMIFDGGTGEIITFNSIDHLLEEGWLTD